MVLDRDAILANMDIRPEIKRLAREQEEDDNNQGGGGGDYDAENNDKNVILISMLDQIPLIEPERQLLVESMNTRIEQLERVSLYVNFGRGRTDLMYWITTHFLQHAKQLQQLELAGCEILVPHATQIANHVLKSSSSSSSSSQKLHTLAFFGNKLGPKGAIALSKGLRENRNSKLTTLSIEYNDITIKGLKAIITSMKHDTTHQHSITNLHLGGNDLSVDSSKLIAEELIPTTHNDIHDQEEGETNNCIALEGLWLEGNCFRDAGCRAIASALPKTKTLKELSLSNNGITTDGCMSLAYALRQNTSLSILDLSQNTAISSNGANVLIDTLRDSNYMLERVDLSDCDAIEPEQINTINSLCEKNRIIKDVFQHLQNDIFTIPLGSIPKAIERIGSKPDIIYMLLQSCPEIIQSGAGTALSSSANQVKDERRNAMKRRKEKQKKQKQKPKETGTCSDRDKATTSDKSTTRRRSWFSSFRGKGKK